MATGGDTMGMTMHERRELHVLERTLREDEPLLVAIFDTWAQVAPPSDRPGRRAWRLFRRR